MPFVLSAADKTRHAERVQAWFREARGEEIGLLQATFLLDAVLDEVAPAVYAAALADVQAHLTAVVQDLDLTLSSGAARSPRR